MTITPEQARKWRDDARPGPWYVHTAPDDPDGTFIYDEDGHMCIAVAPAGSDYREADLTLAAAAPTLARMVAGMREEWGVHVTGYPRNIADWWELCDRPEDRITWFPDEEAAEDFAVEREDDGFDTRIVRRLVSAPEVVE